MLLKPPFSIYLLSTIYISAMYKTQDIVFSKHSIQTQGGAKTHQRLKHCSVYVRDVCVIDTKTRLYRFKTQNLGNIYKDYFFNSCLDSKGFQFVFFAIYFGTFRWVVKVHLT